MEKKQQPMPQEQHTKRRRVWPWIVLAVVILVPLLFLGWTGIYHIPVVTSLFGSDKPDDLGVVISDEAFASAMADNPMTLEGDPSEYCGACTRTYSGTITYDDTATSEEVTSFIAEYNAKAQFLENIHVKFVEGGMELSGFVVPYIKAPTYAKVQVTRASNDSVNIVLEKAKVGNLTVPRSYYDDIASKAEEIAAQLIGEVPGLSFDTLEFHDGYVKYDGTLPKTVTPTDSVRGLEEFL